MKNSLILTILLSLFGLSHALPGQSSSPHQLANAVSCYWCNGSGKCQHDGPVGSGKNDRGQQEYFCSGSGKCQHCSGSGSLGASLGSLTISLHQPGLPTPSPAKP
jgi:hypothetical protein